jgi:hypothetical protein
VGLSFGEEQNLKTTAAIEYASVPIQMSFLTQKTLRRGEIANNANITINSLPVYEGINYLITTNGTIVSFSSAPAAGATVSIIYVDANTLSTVTSTLQPVGGSVNGVETSFTIPNSGSILGYYSLLKAIEVSDSTPGPEVVMSGSVDPSISGT